ncbi:P-loop containing nucleoside triphosphate hydrolase protein [Mariannaea sp. PMI_226]|nr:P-loop containing nucleoside triphosphate hydrolase protein [Mariannaea sp. PMI_226]
MAFTQIATEARCLFGLADLIITTSKTSPSSANTSVVNWSTFLLLLASLKHIIQLTTSFFQETWLSGDNVVIGNFSFIFSFSLQIYGSLGNKGSIFVPIWGIYLVFEGQIILGILTTHSPKMMDLIDLAQATFQIVILWILITINSKPQSLKSEPQKQLSQVSAYYRTFRDILPYVRPNCFLDYATICVSILFIIGYNIIDLKQSNRIMQVLDNLQGSYWANIGLPALLIVGSGILYQLSIACWERVDTDTAVSLKKDVFNRIIHLSPSYHDTTPKSVIQLQINSAPGATKIYKDLFYIVLPALFQLINAVITFSSTFGLYQVFITLCIALGLRLLFNFRNPRSNDLERTNAARKLIKIQDDSIDGYKDAQRFGQTGTIYQQHSDALDHFHQLMRDPWYKSVMYHLAIVLMVTFGRGGSEYLAIRRDATPGQIAKLSDTWNKIPRPVEQASSISRQLQNGVAQCDFVLGVMSEEPSVKEAEGATELICKRGEVIFEGVTFGYEKDKPVLRDIDLNILPGETVAIVGPSGSGKSTIMALIERHYDPQQGTITIDGQDLRTVTRKSIFACLSSVTQDGKIYDEKSILENVKFARVKASNKDAKKACRNAALDPRQFHKGYNTLMGPRHNNLSKGQEQRIFIARCFLMEGKIVLLDEPTNSLDTRTEGKIMEVMGKKNHGKTVIMIAHRLSTIVHADRIIVLEEGRITQQGTHETLKEEGLYGELWRAQTQCTCSQRPG